MARMKMVNGTHVPMTAEEEAQRDAEEAAWAELVLQREKVLYIEKRRAEYPPVETVIEAIMEEREGRPEKMAEVEAIRAAVKDKYPKPVEGVK